MIAIFALYCISEMIVSWCVRYTYYYLDGRIVSAICLFILAIVFSTQYKKIGLFPAFVCSTLFVAIIVDFCMYKKESVLIVSSANVNTLRIYPFVMWFEKYRDLSHPQWGSSIKDIDLVRTYVGTIIFAMALLLEIIIASVAVAVKKSKLDVIKANKILCRTTLGLTVFLFVELMRLVYIGLAM